MILKPGITVYHGSYIEVVAPDNNKCRYGKDFGRGFYVTTDREQAIRFTRTAVKKAISDRLIDPQATEGVLNEYTLADDLSDLNAYEFTDADAQWLHCVVAHRKKNSFEDEVAKWKNYDVISGKIANENTNLVITAYMDGAYGDPGSDRADRIAIDFLEPDNLKDQICFRTPQSIKALSFVGSEKISYER